MLKYFYQPPDLPIRRDNRIVVHVFRNFITTHTVVHKLFFKGLSRDTSRKVLRRLVQRDILIQYPLFGNVAYYRLGQYAIARWNFPRNRSSKLGAQRLPYELGTLAFSSMGDVPRKRLLRHELLAKHPWFPTKLMQWAYFVDGDKLLTVRVEISGRPAKTIKKFAEQIYQYSSHPEFRTLIESSKFRLLVVTATEAQEHALQVESVEQAFPIELQTAHYPELVKFI